MKSIHKDRIHEIIREECGSRYAPGDPNYLALYARAAQKFEEKLTREERQEIEEKVVEWNEKCPPRDMQIK